MKIMQKRFNIQRDDYLRLVGKARQAMAEAVKTAERLELLRKLLELEGKQVQLPPELESNRPKHRRSARAGSFCAGR
ncbi:MAG: hypothetical protein WCA13_18450 [Terriglobales bacterium]